MRTYLSIFLLALCHPALATLSLVHHSTSGSLVCNTGCTAFSLGFTASSGNVLEVFAFNSQNAFINAGNVGFGTWVFPANCAEFQSAGTGEVSCGYVILTSTTTSITMSMNIGSTVNTVLDVREYSSTLGTPAVETVPAPVGSASCGASGTPCNAPAVTVSGSNDVIVSAIATGDSACNANSPFGNFSAPTGDGIADNINTATGTGGAFTQGTACPTAVNAAAGMISLAFKEPTPTSNTNMIFGGKFTAGGKVVTN